MKKTVVYLSGWVLIVILFIANYFLFQTIFNKDYFQWFLKQGAFISIITGLIYLFKNDSSVAKKDIGLISDHPIEFISAHMQQVGFLLMAIGNGLRSSRATKLHLIVDSIITNLLIFPLAILLLGWLLIVTPCQFIVYFICGAPSRLFQTSSSSTLIETSMAPPADNESPQKTTFTLDIKTKPFEFANALAALVLFILSQLLF